MTVFELFNSLGPENVATVYWDTNKTLLEAEIDGISKCNSYVDSFIREYGCHKVINWKIVSIEHNKIYPALTIEY